MSSTSLKDISTKKYLDIRGLSISLARLSASLTSYFVITPSDP
ncbi:hypothetical protein J5U22_01882 [Saccharolobus shibatae]|uniref:Uncharacterized protein n=1 Tax=Saccharolobus shibatae TaxID=2286 RepID=A0A8F5C1M6_9CREN|nr:hypothetical protein J5U22_01882 [Saccharolobus shibatae]